MIPLQHSPVRFGVTFSKKPAPAEAHKDTLSRKMSINTHRHTQPRVRTHINSPTIKPRLVFCMDRKLSEGVHRLNPGSKTSNDRTHVVCFSHPPHRLIFRSNSFLSQRARAYWVLPSGKDWNPGIEQMDRSIQ